MASNDKISVDVTINEEGLNKINEYANSFNSLRQSINSLSQPFNALANNLNLLDKNLSKHTDTLSQLNTENTKLNDTGQQVDEKFNKTLSIFSAGAGIVSAFGAELKLLSGSLTGGLSIIIAFLPEIINFATALFKGKDAAGAMAANFKTLNEVMKDSNREASSEVTRLKLLYTSATDVNNGYIDRIKSVRELKKEYPQHLKALSDEEILNGKAKDTYDKLTRSLIDNARAKAALNKMGSEANKMLDADFQIEKIKNANYNEKKQYEREAAAAGNGSRGVAGRYPLQYYKEQSDKRAKIAIDEQEKIKNSAQNSMEFLTRFAGGANAIAKTITADVDATPVNKSHNKTYWEAELEKQQNALDTLDATAKNFKQKAAPIIKQMRDIKKILSSYSDNETEIHAPKKAKQPKEETFTALPLLDAVPSSINPFEKQRKAHEKELALLKKQFDDNLIAEDEYNKKRKELEEKYQDGVTTKVKSVIFDNDAVNEFRKKNQELWDQIEKDEKGTKSILPWEKHNAEKKLIEDKYAYEVLQARGNTEKIKELETKKLLDLKALNEQYEQQKKEFAINTAQQVADKAFSIIGNNLKANSDAKIKSLEKDKAAELSDKNLTETQRKAIEDKYQKKENQEKVKAFKADQKAQVAQAIINGALAVTKATAQTGVLAPFVIPGIIASTAMQVATIVAQKPPAFARGGHFVSDGRGAVLSGYSRTDDTNAYLRSGEAVVVSEAMRNPWARNLVSAINVAHGGRDFSVPNTTRGYAIGGIFTDGGNANRYYNQPVNDAKELANSLAYQMINNFPPIYVDVKDVNNQQGILAQTVNRVNL